MSGDPAKDAARARVADLVRRFNPHFPSIVDIQCGEKAILL